MTVFELNEKYKNCPERVSKYEINSKRYAVHGHFIGDKDIDDIIEEIAYHKALKAPVFLRINWEKTIAKSREICYNNGSRKGLLCYGK